VAAITIHTGIVTGPKHAPLSDGAFRLWVHALCWSKEHLTDGFVPAHMLTALHPKARRFVPELCATFVPGKAPLWEQADGGYRVHDYTDWQDSSADVQERRRKWRQKKVGRSTASPLESLGETKGESPEIPLAGSGSGHGQGIGIRGKQPSDPLPFDAWLSLAEAWNTQARRVAAWASIETGMLPRDSKRRLFDALRACPDLNVWDARFARAAASSHLTGRNGKGFVADAWWVLAHVAELDAGRYDDRAKATPSADDEEARYRRLYPTRTAEQIAAENEERKLAAEERAARKAREAASA
jgi:hypothetical protein